MRILVVATVLLLSAAPAAQAQAAPSKRPSAVDRCMEAGISMEILMCVSGLTQVQDARLNRAYKAAMAPLKPERKTALRSTQRAWIASRDAECGAYADEAEFGQQGKIEAEICALDRTRERAGELERYR
jgi:uncharacterized protein YecT (DUF1311 family)